MKLYVWAQYYFAAAHKQVSSKEIVFYNGHNHDAKPSQKDKDEVIADLVAEVQAVADKKSLQAPDDVATAAEIKTRKAH